MVSEDAIHFKENSTEEKDMLIPLLRELVGSLQCKGCSREFSNENEPILLPCQHSICRDCVKCSQDHIQCPFHKLHKYPKELPLAVNKPLSKCIYFHEQSKEILEEFASTTFQTDNLVSTVKREEEQVFTVTAPTLIHTFLKQNLQQSQVDVWNNLFLDSVEECFQTPLVCSICFSICEDVCILKDCQHSFCRDCMIQHYANQCNSHSPHSTQSHGTVTPLTYHQETKNEVEYHMECPLCRTSYKGQDIEQTLHETDYQLQIICDKLNAVQIYLIQRNKYIQAETLSEKLSTSHLKPYLQCHGYLPFVPFKDEIDLQSQMKRQIDSFVKKAWFSPDQVVSEPNFTIEQVERRFVPFYIWRACATLKAEFNVNYPNESKPRSVKTEMNHFRKKMIYCAASSSSLQSFIPKHLIGYVKQLSPWQLGALKNVTVPFLLENEQELLQNGIPVQQPEVIFKKKIHKTFQQHIKQYCANEQQLIKKELEAHYNSNKQTEISISNLHYTCTNRTRLMNHRLLLLPIFVVRYTFHKHSYHMILNGSNLNVAFGERPKATGKVLAAIGASLTQTPFLLIYSIIAINLWRKKSKQKKKQLSKQYII